MSRPYSKPLLIVAVASAWAIPGPGCADSQADPPLAIGDYALPANARR